MASLPLHLGRFLFWMFRHRAGVTWGVLLFPLLFVGLMIICKLLLPRFYLYLVTENNIVEWTTCLVYLLASAVAASLAVDLRRQSRAIFSGLYFVLAAGLLVISMEEISWGQQLIKNSSPGFFQEYNYKGETNFHNLSGFPLHMTFILVGIYGAFSRLILSRTYNHNTDLTELLTPPYYLFLYFFLPCALYAYYEYLYYTRLQPFGLTWGEFFTPDHFIIAKDQEPVELLLGLGFLLFVVVNKVHHRRGPAARLVPGRAT